MKRASGEPAARAAARLCATPPEVFDPDEIPTSPVNSGVLMTMPQAREAMLAFPADQHALVWAIARAFWDEGFMTARVNGSRVCPLDRSPAGVNTLAPLGKQKR